MSADRTFADLVAGRVPCHRVYEDGEHLAFLAERPVRPGHTVVIPKRVADAVWDLSDAEHEALWRCARRVAVLLRERLPAPRICVAVVGWEVRHAHVHLVPTDQPGQFPPLGGPAAPADELAALAARLRRSATGG